MGNLKGKNKENKDTTENKPVKANPTDDKWGGIFTEKVVQIMKLLKELRSQQKNNEEKEK